MQKEKKMFWLSWDNVLVDIFNLNLPRDAYLQKEKLAAINFMLAYCCFKV